MFRGNREFASEVERSHRPIRSSDHLLKNIHNMFFLSEGSRKKIGHEISDFINSFINLTISETTLGAMQYVIEHIIQFYTCFEVTERYSNDICVSERITRRYTVHLQLFYFKKSKKENK